MSVATRGTGIDVSGLVPQVSRTGPAFENADSAAPPDDFVDSSNSFLSNDTADQQPQQVRPGEGQQMVADWIRNSAMMADKEATNKSFEPSCAFEAIGYCVKGVLINGFCSYHTRLMFNIVHSMQGTLTRSSNDRIVHTKQLRAFIRYPLRFSANLYRVMPIPELCRDIKEYEENLKLDLFAYIINQRKNKKYNDLELATTKGLLLRIVQLLSNTPKQQYNDNDTIILSSALNWRNYMADRLKEIKYDINLLFLAQGDSGPELRYIKLQDCSILTQAMVLLFDVPYVQCPSLNYEWLSIPAAVSVYGEKSLVVDATRASHGTASNLGVPTLGDPATCSYIRLDKNEKILIMEENWTPASEICFPSEIDKSELLGLDDRRSNQNNSIVSQA